MRCRFVITLVLALALLFTADSRRVGTRAAELPPSLSDREFWQLSVGASEPGGYFRSENLTSNELRFQDVIPELVGRTRPGEVYLGVGPEQNFTYIAATKPSMAIIVDIRRGNLLLQLMYKAVFELARDRADFVGLLFSRERPAGLTAESTVGDVFTRFGDVVPARSLYAQHLRAIQQLLTTTHRLPLTRDDLDGIAHVYEAFYASGYAIRSSPTYDELMTATDQHGRPRGYLASEDSFAFLKDLESRNLVVPVVGDFGGPKAIRSIGAYLKMRGATVGAFYLSNVEQYLDQDGKMPAFCRSVALLPIDSSSTFIRSSSRGAGGFGLGYGRGFVSSLGDIAGEVRRCVAQP
jgi:hypothetical protein